MRLDTEHFYLANMLVLFDFVTSWSASTCQRINDKDMPMGFNFTIFIPDDYYLGLYSQCDEATKISKEIQGKRVYGQCD